MEQISTEYKTFWETAKEIADEDIKVYPLYKKELKRDRVEKHLIGMIELYSTRYGDPDQKLQILNFLEKQLFGETPIENEASPLTYNTWISLRKTILSNEYREEQ